MHIFILIALLLLAYIVFKIIGYNKIAFIFKMFSLVVFAFIIFLIYAPRNYIKLIPFCIISDSEVEEVESGVIYLSSGVSIANMNNFYFSEDTSVNELVEYINLNRKNIYLQVSNGSNIIYSKNLGMLNKSDTDYILKVIDDYYSKSILPRDKIRIQVLMFYLDI